MDNQSTKTVEKRFENVAKSKTFHNILNTYDLKKKSVLDIGCSYGEFLAHFGKGSTGVTVSQEEVEYGKKIGLDLRFGNIEDENLILNDKYDVIFANNIFEHLGSPHNFLCKIKKYLKSDGLLILGVPCIPKFIFLLRFNKFRGSLASLHINFFTKNTLERTVVMAGWRILDTRGFHFFNSFIDHLLDGIYPHFYVVTTPIKDFVYSEKRIKELNGYNGKI